MRRVALVIFGLPLIVVAGIVLVPRSNTSVSHHGEVTTSSDASATLAVLAAGSVNSTATPAKSAGRPVYRYSVIPGGVRSARELQEASRRDSSVAAHYAGFHYDQARVTRLKKSRLVYLSYRRNGRILWTKAAHRLPEGESVLTDGNIAARTRCANQMSAHQRLPVAEAEPTLAQLEELIPQVAPPVQANFPAQYQSALISPSNPAGRGPEGGTPVLGGLPIGPGAIGGSGGTGTPGGNPGGGGSNQPPPSPVPEPGSLLLVSSGLAALAAAYRKRKASR